MTAVERSSALWLDQAVGHHVEGDLNAADASTLTAKIKSYVGVTWVLIAEAHERKAHKALGYPTWGEYVEAEFDMSRSRSYQLISQARVVLEISGSVSTSVDISEAAARDLAPMLGEAKNAAVEAAEALGDDATDEDKAKAVTEALDSLRATAVEAARPKATQTHRVTETTTTTFDPETGEVLSPTGDNEDPTQEESGDDVSQGQGSPSSGPATAAPTTGVSDTESDSDTADEEGSGSRSAPPVDPTLGYRAKASNYRAEVRSHLLKLDPERVLITSDEPDHWRQFSQDVRGWLDSLDSLLADNRHLKAVR